MASGISATKEDFDKGFKDTTDIKEQFDSSLSQLKGQIEAAASGWHGPAGSALQNLMVRFDESARKASNVLQDLGDKVNAAGGGIQEAEDANQQSISKITGALG